MFYLGIDQHAKQLTINLRDIDGQAVLRRQVSTQPDKVLAFFEQLTARCAKEGCAHSCHPIAFILGDQFQSAISSICIGSCSVVSMPIVTRFMNYCRVLRSPGQGDGGEDK